MPRLNSRLPFPGHAAVLALPFALLLGLAAAAQEDAASAGSGTAVSSGMKTDTSLPVQVESDTLSVDQESGLAIFTGNVRATQGEVTITAPKGTLYYTEDRSDIDRIHMEGGVLMTNKTEAVKGQDAVYTVATGQVVVTGDVLITQGKSTIAGQKLTYDLNTGAGLMQGGRVQSVFTPRKGGKSAAAAEGAAEPAAPEGSE